MRPARGIAGRGPSHWQRSQLIWRRPSVGTEIIQLRPHGPTGSVWTFGPRRGARCHCARKQRRSRPPGLPGSMTGSASLPCAGSEAVSCSPGAREYPLQSRRALIPGMPLTFDAGSVRVKVRRDRPVSASTFAADVVDDCRRPWLVTIAAAGFASRFRLVALRSGIR